MGLNKRLGEDWYDELGQEYITNVLSNIGYHIGIGRYNGKKVIPEAGSELTFKAFRLTPYNSVKVVIIGQDPYHTQGVFNGVAFGNGFPNDPAGKIQPSLRNIVKELYRSYGDDSVIDYSLYTWAGQGVLLLNTAHTVVTGDAGSHLDLWFPFTKRVFDVLNKKDDLIWMLWGKKAQNYSKYIYNNTHTVLTAGHPSPLNRSDPFVGSGIFVKSDEILKTNKIKWVYE